MRINRYDLLKAISIAYKSEDFDTYDELLKLYYSLIDQETIKSNFITVFHSYNIISDSALNLISNSVEV